MKNYSRIQFEKRARSAHRKAIWIGIFLVLLLIISIFLYSVLIPVRSDRARFSELASQHAGIEHVQVFKESNRNGNYYSIQGSASDHRSYLAVFDSKSHLIRRISVDQRVSDGRLNRIFHRYDIGKVYSLAPSIYKKKLVLEMSYRGRKNTINFLTIDYKSGRVYRLIRGI